VARSPRRAEVRFWRSWIASRGGDWPEAFERGMDPHAPFDEPLLNEHISALQVEEVEILDVGAGPLTVLGKVHPTKRLRITPVDPLADEYDELLTEAGLTPPVRTVTCAGEELVAWCGTERFDVVYARNAIDHSVDAPHVVEQMLAVLRPGGLLGLRHYRNEGELERYRGMHKWNFDSDNGDFVIWGENGARINMTERLAQRADVECWLHPTDYHAPLVACRITKHGA
jgi:SAM-dependent methyltransferase